MGCDSNRGAKRMDLPGCKHREGSSRQMLETGILLENISALLKNYLLRLERCL
jgi:hypothetical protein